MGSDRDVVILADDIDVLVGRMCDDVDLASLAGDVSATKLIVDFQPGPVMARSRGQKSGVQFRCQTQSRHNAKFGLGVLLILTGPRAFKNGNSSFVGPLTCAGLCLDHKPVGQGSAN